MSKVFLIRGILIVMGLSTAISDFLIERQSTDSDKEAIKMLMEEKKQADYNLFYYKHRKFFNGH